MRDELEDERSENGWALEFMNRMGEKVRCSDAANLKEYVEGLEAENAKLRELVRDMLACINNVSAHDTYCWDYCDFCKMYITKGRCDFESRMRELGVEI